MPAACSASRSAAVCGSVDVSLTNNVPPFRISSVRLPPRSVQRKRPASEGSAVHVIVDDRAVVALDLAVGHAVDAEVRAQQAACLRENARRIGERPDRVVQFPKERLPIIDPAQRLLRARALAGCPYALGGHLDQRDLIACPDARRRAVDAERREPLDLL